VTRAPRRAKQEIAQREEQIVALRLRHSPFCGDRAHPSGSTRVTTSGAFNKALRRNTDQDIQTHHWSELAELDAQQARLRTIDQATFLRLAEKLAAFLGRLRSSADTLDIMERQRIVRLVVKEVLIGDDNIVPCGTLAPGLVPGIA
jgi:hypothetical protein